LFVFGKWNLLVAHPCEICYNAEKGGIGMGILCAFGIGSGKILAKNHSVPGLVTQVSRCWWLSVKTKPARLYDSAENTVNPYIITFSYQVDGVSHTGKLYIPINYRVPQKGETISVYYDPETPKRYACYAFGPGSVHISW